MKILVLASSYPRFPGDGTAPFVKSLSEELARLGHQVHVLAPYDPAVQETSDSPVSVYRFRYVWADSLCIVGHAKSLEADVRLKKTVYFLTPLYLLCGAIALIRLARKYQFNLIHTHWVLPNGPIGALCARLLRLPLVITLHGSDIFVANRNLLFSQVARFALRSADAVTACSPELKSWAVQMGAKESSVHLVPWGADPQRFAAQDASGLRVKLGLEPDELVVLAMGRLVYKKGFEYLIRAVPKIPRTIPWRLIIGGDGDLRDNLQQLACQLGVEERVLFLGQVPWDEVPGCLSLCDVFVAPSIRDRSGNLDGLPTVILEAMSVGRPIVSTEIAGIPLVVRDGENGFLVPEKSPQGLATAIGRLLASSELRARQGAVSRRMVEQELNWKSVAREFEQLLRTVAGVGEVKA